MGTEPDDRTVPTASGARKAFRDRRGRIGASPGVLDPFSPRETEDYATLITWAAHQSWSRRQFKALKLRRSAEALARH